MEDTRFSHIAKDPRFRKPKREDRKVKIDERFKHMFNDKKFKVKCEVDKRGRPLASTSGENLKKYYDLPSDNESNSDSETSDDSSESESNESEEITANEINKRETLLATDSRFQITENFTANKSESDSDDESVSEEETTKHGDAVDYARGEALLSSSSEDDSSDDGDGELSDNEVEHDWGEIDKETPQTDEVSSRLALCNMDWDRINAEDILVIIDSFKPSGGIIKSVTVYPSDFGLQRMKEEAVKGPAELLEPSKKTQRKKKKEDDNEEGSEYQTEKLRRYQLNKLKYFYAVIQCDNSDTANHLYENCDGLEFETSANKLDLRLIPDGMTFDQEPKSVATDSLDIASYKPSAFINSALQQSNVECTWDEDDVKRSLVTRKKIKEDEIENLNLEDYLASDSESDAEAYCGVEDPSFAVEAEDGDSNDEESSIEKYRKLMNLTTDTNKKSSKEEPEMEMEVTWEIGTKETTEKLVEQQMNKKDLTPWETFLKKKKEKKRQRKLERQNFAKLKGADSDDSKDEENLQSDDDVPSDVDMNDPFFKDAYEDLNNGTSESTKAKKKKKTKKSKRPDEEEPDEELRLMMMDGDDHKQHFSLKKLIVPEKESKTKMKRRLKKEAALKNKGAQTTDGFTLDVADSRFQAIYENAQYNIDPSAPEFKQTENMKILVKEKVKQSGKRLKDRGTTNDDNPSKKLKVQLDDSSVNKEQSIDSLIKSVKAKTKQFESKKKMRIDVQK